MVVDASAAVLGLLDDSDAHLAAAGGWADHARPIPAGLRLLRNTNVLHFWCEHDDHYPSQR